MNNSKSTLPNTGSSTAFPRSTTGASRATFASRPTECESETEQELRCWIREAAKVCRLAASGDLEPRVLHVTSEVDPEIAELMHSINHLLDMTDAFVREAAATMVHAEKGEFYRRVLLKGMRGSFRSAANTINESTDAMEAGSEALKEAQQKRAALTTEVASATQVVAHLSDASSEIGEMSDLIGTIAKQSNMLALNAAIEAARAGQAGAGFGVVASQVRSLSEKTAEATRDITSKVKAIQQASNEVHGTIRSICKTLQADCPKAL